MPTYEYECKSCGHVFDEFQSMSDPALTTCPKCNEDSLRRLIGGGIGVIFKGSGFYVTDSKNGSSANGGGAAKKGTSESSAAEGASSESSGTSTESTSTESKSADAKSDSSDKKSAATKSAAAK